MVNYEVDDVAHHHQKIAALTQIQSCSVSFATLSNARPQQHSLTMRVGGDCSCDVIFRHHVFLSLGKPDYNGSKKAKIVLTNTERVTRRASKTHERWLICSNYTIMYVYLYFSCVCGRGVVHYRDSSSTWQRTIRTVSLYVGCQCSTSPPSSTPMYSRRLCFNWP